MKHQGIHLQWRTADDSPTTAQTDGSYSMSLEGTAVCVCPSCLQRFPKKSGQACVDCRCPVCNVPLRNN
ncbi:hypothetical protein [Desulfovermiculus halophilus]|uniref:hypothetical protein n=1 Tax=Desulfovermiculus halophilus TaxID=339722 RepID=UPI00048514B7|nr:hypothetical protein [Desulfovermiculus halophilus]